MNTLSELKSLGVNDALSYIYTNKYELANSIKVALILSSNEIPQDQAQLLAQFQVEDGVYNHPPSENYIADGYGYAPKRRFRKRKSPKRRSRSSPKHKY